MPQKDTVHIVALDSATTACEVAILSMRGTRKRVYTHSCADHAGHGGGAAEAMLPMVATRLEQAGIDRGQLTAVAFGQGPGAFTGLRVACGVAQGMAYALGIPVVPVGSLHAMAQAAGDDTPADEATTTIRVVMQDARMGEVYAAAYSKRASKRASKKTLKNAGNTVTTKAVTTDAAYWQPLCAPALLAASDVPHWLAQHRAGWQDTVLQDARPPAIDLLGNAAEAYPELRTLSVAGEALHWLPPTPPGSTAHSTTQAAAIAELGWYFWQQGNTLPPAQAAPLYVRDKVAYTTAEREQGQGGNPRVERVENVDSQASATHKTAPSALGSGLGATITSIRVDDLDSVVEIERRTQMYPWTRGQIQDSLHADCEGWVIREAGQVPGGVCGFYLLMKAPDVAHLLLLGVSPEYQRRGLGHALLRHCEQRTAQLALPAVLLEVRPSNQKALDFYHHRGFTRIGVRKGYYPDERAGREDAWVMQKTVQKTIPA